MASDFPSSNPFRRKPTPSGPTNPIPEATLKQTHVAYQQVQSLPDATNLPVPDLRIPKKITKKVRVQSPPPASPASPSNHAFPIGTDISSHKSIPSLRDEDPFDSTSSSSDEDLPVPPPQRAPANPFAKTLETMERAERPPPVVVPPNLTSPVRASMDVDAFKRLLMTGNSGVEVTAGPPAALSSGHLQHDGGSSTDTSSVSRQSLFESIQEVPLETPRTSHELSELEDDRRSGLSSGLTMTRMKPPPPSSRHGKSIKLDLRNNGLSASSTTSLVSPQLHTPNSFSSTNSQNFFPASPALDRSNSDLNKPLPPAPANRASHDSDRESIFDKEAAGKIPEPQSPPTASSYRKTPPTPPIARRQSQRVAGPKILKEPGRLSPRAEEESIHSIDSTDSGLHRSVSTKAPPRPPSRRPLSIRRDTTPNALVSPSSIVSPTDMNGPPPTPPARGSSRRMSGRPPSVNSMEISQSKKASMAPPPPPSRHGRSSADGDSIRRVSNETGRRSSSESIQLGFSSGPPPGDILAEVARLQRDIDDLRVRSAS